MQQAIHHLVVPTGGKGLYEITAPVRFWLSGQDISMGLLTIFCRHTSASLLIQENADPEVKTDLQGFFDRRVPEEPGRYAHEAEGPDDMPAHIRTALTNTSLAIPVDQGQLVLGPWQGLFLFEHRVQPWRRHIVLHVIGE